MKRHSLAAAALLSLAPACVFVVHADHDLDARDHFAAGWAHPGALAFAGDLDDLGWEVERFSPRGDLWRYEVTDGDARATVLVELRSGGRYEVRELRGECEALEPLLEHDHDDDLDDD